MSIRKQSITMEKKKKKEKENNKAWLDSYNGRKSMIVDC